MIAQTEKQTYTPETYLEFELSSDERHEYIDGELIPMTGGTPNHNEIASIQYFGQIFGMKDRR
jgi:Uma2 family endonuclease